MTDTTKHHDNNATQKLSFEDIARLILSPQEFSATYIHCLSLDIQKLLDKPEALKALGLCKVDSFDWKHACMIELACENKNVEAAIIERDREIKLIEKLEAELKAVRDMRDKLMNCGIRLLPTRLKYQTAIDYEVMINTLKEAQAQQAKEKETK